MNLRMSQRKRLLCVTDNRFWLGGYGSSQRISEMLSWLASEWQIAVFFPRSLPENEGWHAVHIFPWLQVYHATGMFAEGEIVRRPMRLEDTVVGFRPAVLMTEYFWMTPTLQSCPDEFLRDVLLVLDTHDVMHQRTDAFKQLGIDYWIQVTREEEKFWLEHYDMLVAIQNEEAAILRDMTDRPVVTVAHARKVDPLPLPNNGNTRRLGLFSSRGASQVHSIRTFLLETWPQLIGTFPDLQLHIFGHVADSLTDISIPDGVRIRGYVEDLREAYLEMHAVINPAVLASGLQIKSVEALCFGRALLTTQIGLTGVPAAQSNQSPFLICDTIEDWKSAIASVVHDDATLKRRASLAIDFAKRNFDNDHLYGAFSQQLCAALENLPTHQQPSLQTRIRAAMHAFRRVNVIPKMDPGDKRRVLIAGTGVRAQLLFACLPQDVEVFAFLDCDRTRQGGSIYDRPVFSPNIVTQGWKGTLFVTDESFEGGASKFQKAGITIADASSHMRNFILLGCKRLLDLALAVIPESGEVHIIRLEDTFESEPKGRISQLLKEIGDQPIVIAHPDHEKINELLKTSGFADRRITKFAPLIPQAIVIFGTGVAAEHAWACIDDKSRVLVFVDNNPRKQGTEFLGRPVIAPAQLGDFPAADVQIASMYHNEIREQLIALGVDENRIKSFDGKRVQGAFRPKNVFRSVCLTANILCNWTEQDVATILFAVLSTKKILVDWFDQRAVSLALIARSAGCETTIAGNTECRENLRDTGVFVLDTSMPTGEYELVFHSESGVCDPGGGTHAQFVIVQRDGGLMLEVET